MYCKGVGMTCAASTSTPNFLVINDTCRVSVNADSALEANAKKLAVSEAVKQVRSIITDKKAAWKAKPVTSVLRVIIRLRLSAPDVLSEFEV